MAKNSFKSLARAPRSLKDEYEPALETRLIKGT